MLLVYRAIAAFLAVLIVIVTLRQRSTAAQVTGALVLVPLLLRVLLVK